MSTKQLRQAADVRLSGGDGKLMARVGKSYADHLMVATRGTLLIPEFLAALTANESGGDPNARRFEPGVYRRLKEVAAGRLAGYGGVTKSLLEKEISRIGSGAQHGAAGTTQTGSSAVAEATGTAGSAKSPSTAALADDFIRRLATSWGLTQIMGYHLIGRGEPIERLLEPEFHYRIAVELIQDFALRHHLDPGRDFEALFRCWNTGRPDGQTTDPAYAEKGLRRLELYRELAMKDTPPARQEDQATVQHA